MPPPRGDHHDGRLIPSRAYNSVGYREQVRAQQSEVKVADIASGPWAIARLLATEHDVTYRVTYRTPADFVSGLSPAFITLGVLCAIGVAVGATIQRSNATTTASSSG